MARHVVVGKGPIGSTLADTLVEQGHDVLVVSRSGGQHPHLEHRSADIASPGTLRELAHGADVLYNCVNPPYHRWPTDWPPLHAAFLDAAEATDAVLVTTSNLYGHGAGSGVMREDTPLASAEVKGQVTTAVNTVFSYNYADVAKTEKAAQELLTGKAVQQYNQLFALVRKQAPQQKQVLTTAVTDSAVKSLAGDRARLLVFADQRNTRTDTNKTSYSAAVFAVDALYADGKWKISAIDTLGA